MTRQKAIEFSDMLLEEASDWHARLSSDAACEDDWAAFTVWLETDEKNRLAYDHVEDVAHELSEMSEVFLSDIDEDGAAEKAKGGEVIQAAWRWKNRNVWGGFAAAAAAVMLVIGNLGIFSDPVLVTQEYFTGYGEQQEVRLEDGSIVQLNTNSRLLVTYSEDERRTKLAYGEALFSVSKAKDRPFYVAVGDQQVRVVGTKFNVLRHEGTVTVTVAEGIVDVSDIENTTRKDRLTAGKQLTHSEGSRESQVSDVNAEMFITWESGILAYEDAPLVVAINDLGRYFEQPIVVVGDVSHITFSGILNVRDPDAVLTLLEETLPITIEQSAGEIKVTAKN